MARAVYAHLRPELAVTDTTTAEYYADKPGAAPRPANSVLDLAKATAAGVAFPDWRDRLEAYVRAL